MNDFEIFSIALIIAVISFVFTFYVLCVSIISSFYFKHFPAFLLLTLGSYGIAGSIIRHFSFPLS